VKLVFVAAGEWNNLQLAHSQVMHRTVQNMKFQHIDDVSRNLTWFCECEKKLVKTWLDADMETEKYPNKHGNEFSNTW
jgi:hypothetical protein